MLLSVPFASRKALFDALSSENRAVNHEVRVEVNFTVSHAAGAAAQRHRRRCGLSRVAADNHARDAVLQAELAELQAVRGKLAKTEEAVAWWTRQVQRLPATAFFQRRPPPPPLLGAAPPPAPPKDPSFPARIAALQDVKADSLRARARELDALVGGCVPSASVTQCGRSTPRPTRGAPGPTSAARGTRGWRRSRATSAASGTAPTWMRPSPDSTEELGRRSVVLRRGPGDAALRSARAPTGRRARASTQAQVRRLRTSRARPRARPPIFGRNGSVQIERDADSYFFRSRQANLSAYWSAELARAELEDRNRSCHIESCSQCLPSCVLPWFEAAVGVAALHASAAPRSASSTARRAASRPAPPRPAEGPPRSQYASDAGQHMNAMHGAVRTTAGHGPVPERVFAESYEVCVNNKRGRVPREGVSCRKEHRTPPMGHFTAGFADGAPP